MTRSLRVRSQDRDLDQLVISLFIDIVGYSRLLVTQQSEQIETPLGATGLDAMFDPLRNDPRFQKLCEEKKP